MKIEIKDIDATTTWEPTVWETMYTPNSSPILPSKKVIRRLKQLGEYDKYYHFEFRVVHHSTEMIKTLLGK